MPVYNGGEEFRRALDHMLAQTEGRFEIIISDNASTDGITQQIAEEYAQRDSRIRYTRQSVNRGAIANFLWVADQARGKYFMWAAHDDTWSSNYLEVLTRKLEQNPEAVLATPLVKLQKKGRDGSWSQKTMPAAPNLDRWQTLNVFIRDAGCEWIYGVYRTDWLKTATPQWTGYPLEFGDLVWMFDLLVREQVVGDDAAEFSYTNNHKTQKNLSRRMSKIETWSKLIHHLIRISFTRVPESERGQALICAMRLIYRFHIYRRGVLGTPYNLVKLAVLWSRFGVEEVIKQLAGFRWVRGETLVARTGLPLDMGEVAK